ncbi:BREX system P-loop protein BrxC [Desulfonatronum parangueonense]
MRIRDLFDPSRDIHRAIEKVISYGASQEIRLKSEISEYIVTESIEEQMEKLLRLMQTAMEQGGENEIGVWVSGFYGSGKSSFTKYLGLALDENVSVEGVPFLKHLQNRLHKPQTKALLSTVATRFPAAVVLLDLASSMLAGATMEEVSTVLYYKVLQWAGYSRNLKVAALERRMQKDGRYTEFLDRIQGELGVPWKSVQNDPLVVDSLLPEIAHAMYPVLFKTPTAFSTETSEVVVFENDRVKEMIDIVRETSGKQCVIFIIDEVGQYVGPRHNLILNLDGLAKNLKAIGEGKVWIVGTAQQTLTEDDPRVALNSPELYKLGARFPIQIDLESSDIKEICTRRLLGKSPKGQSILEDAFEKQGQSLRHSTKLQDAKYYAADFDRATFVNLYPFLPAHFDILLHLLGALAKSTGGVGLRSAIKVIQDILVEGPARGDMPVADAPVGWLATTVTLYDALHRDIHRAFPSLHKAMEKVQIRFPGPSLHQDVAKTVAVLQVLGNMPVTRGNVAALMHPGLDSSSRRDQVELAIADLITDSIVPFGEKDGNLCFFSEKLNDIDQERAQIPLRSIEVRRIENEALREVFQPQPKVTLHGSLTVTSGLKAVHGPNISSLSGEKEIIQTHVEFVDPLERDAVRDRMLDESRQRSFENVIFLLGYADPAIREQAGEIYRCNEIVLRHRSDPDQEVKDYCTAQLDRAARLVLDLQQTLRRNLLQGSFIFRGSTTALNSLGQDVLEAAKKHLNDVAAQVFHRYGDAPVRADTNLAEKFLRLGNLMAVTAALDPLHLVQISGGSPQINTGHKAVISIRDYVERTGSVEGKRLSDHFSGDPYGWSPDTLRYLVAGMLLAGMIKLKISSRDVLVNGQQAVDALRTNASFKNVGISLRDAPVPMEVLARAAERLTDLVGETVMAYPEDEVSKAAVKHFPRFQHQFGPLAEKLENLGQPGAEIVRTLNQELADVLLTDASDLPHRLGSEESPLYDGLKWAAQVDLALKNGLESVVRDLQNYRREIADLPDSGAPGDLRKNLSEDLELLGQRLESTDFHHHLTDYNTLLTNIRARIEETIKRVAQDQDKSIKMAGQSLSYLPDWKELTQEEKTNTLAQLDALILEPGQGIAGLKELLSQEYVISTTMSRLTEYVAKRGHEHRIERMKQKKEDNFREGRTKLTRNFAIPSMVSDPAQIESLIHKLQNLKEELTSYSEIEVTISLE